MAVDSNAKRLLQSNNTGRTQCSPNMPTGRNNCDRTNTAFKKLGEIMQVIEATTQKRSASVSTSVHST